MSHNESHRRRAAIVLIAAASLSLPLVSVAQAQVRTQAGRVTFDPYVAGWDTYYAVRDRTAYHGHFIDPWNDRSSYEPNGG